MYCEAEAKKRTTIIENDLSAEAYNSVRKFKSYEAYLCDKALKEEIIKELSMRIVAIFDECGYKETGISLCEIYGTQEEIQAAYDSLWQYKTSQMKQAMRYACDFTKTIYEYSKPIAA